MTNHNQSTVPTKVPVIEHYNFGGNEIFSIKCPACGVLQKLVKNNNRGWGEFQIIESGEVFPEFVCNQVDPFCNCSVSIRLTNYQPF